MQLLNHPFFLFWIVQTTITTWTYYQHLLSGWSSHVLDGPCIWAAWVYTTLYKDVYYCKIEIHGPLKENTHVKCGICSSKRMLWYFCLVMLCNGYCMPCLSICLLIVSTFLSCILYVVLISYVCQDVYWWIKLYVLILYFFCCVFISYVC